MTPRITINYIGTKSDPDDIIKELLQGTGIDYYKDDKTLFGSHTYHLPKMKTGELNKLEVHLEKLSKIFKSKNKINNMSFSVN